MLSKDPSSLSVKAKMPTNEQQQPHKLPEIDDIQHISNESVELDTTLLEDSVFELMYIQKRRHVALCATKLYL